MIDYKEQAADERWRKRSREIMQRDKFTCQLCGKKHVRLNVHHIKYLKGIDYWDYPDELLMTVCEVCHAKIHGKYDKPKKENKPAKEKFVFYNCLFYEERLQEPTDKIIYSYLVYKSIATMEAAFDSNGDFSVSTTTANKDEKVNESMFTELSAEMSRMQEKIDSLTNAVNAVIQQKEEVTELSWWDLHKSGIYYVIAILIIGFIGYLILKH